MLLSILALISLTPDLHWQPLGEPGCGGAMTAISVSPYDPKRVLVAGDMLGIGLSEDQGDSWQATFGLPSYEIADFTWDPVNPNTVWAGSMSGPLKSIDGGRNWRSMRKGLPSISEGSYSAPVEKVLYDPTIPGRLLAFGGSSRRWESPSRPLWGAVWESADGGEYWSRLVTLKGNIVAAVVHRRPGASSIWCALVDQVGFFRSGDGGRTWSMHNEGLTNQNVRRLVLDPTGTGRLILSLGNAGKVPGGVFVSEDEGSSWKPLAIGLSQAVGQGDNDTARYDSLAIAPSLPSRLMTGDTAWNTGVVYQSEDRGKSWKPMVSKAEGRGFKLQTATFAGCGLSYLAYAPTNPNVAFGVNTEFIARTRDGGRTWDDASSKLLPNGNWAGRGYSGWCSTQVRFDPYREGRAVVQALDACRAWLSEDGLKSWRYGKGFGTPWQGGRDLAWTRSDTVWAVFGQFGAFNGVGRSDDGGRTWNVLTGAEHGLPEEGGGQPEPRAIIADPEKPNRVWALIGQRLFRSVDGDRFTPLATSRIECIAWGSGQLYAGGEGVSVSRDGNKFTPIGGPSLIDRIVVDRSGAVWVAATRSARPGVWRYAQGSWKRLFDEPNVASIAVDPTNPSRIAVTTNDQPYHDLCRASGIWLSSDGGVTWSLHNEGLGMLRGAAIEFEPFHGETLVFGSNGRGFWKTNWPHSVKPIGTRRYISTEDDVKSAELLKPNEIRWLNSSMTDEDEVFLIWHPERKDQNSIQVVQDKQVFHSTPASLRLDARHANAQVGKGFQCGTATKIQVSGYMKSQGWIYAYIGIQPIDSQGKPIDFLPIGYVQGNKDWTLFSKTVTMPLGTRARVTLQVEGTGSVWLDDVDVRSRG